MVNGEIESDSPLPGKACLEVVLSDLSGNRLRYARTTEKNCRRLFLAHPDLTGYKEELDPGKEKLLAFGFPELLVEDPANPSASLTNATIKAWYSDTSFKAVIVSATDPAHGLPVDDGIGFRDENGEPYEALPMGDYRVRVTLSATDGANEQTVPSANKKDILARDEKHILAEDEKIIHIARQENQLICRFNPTEHKARMKKWAAEQGIAVINDCLPGYLDPYLGTWYYHMGLLPMYRANDLASYLDTKTHLFVYLMEEDSTSYETELSFLQSRNEVGNPERFQAYAYDIGEAVIRKGKPDEREGKVVPFGKDECLRVCRIDTVNELAKENVFNLNEEAVVSMRPGFSTDERRASDKAQAGSLSEAGFGGSVIVNPGDRIGVMCVVRPFQLDPKDFVLKPENVYAIRNRIETLRYTFDDGTKTWTEDRKLLMERIDGKSIGKSVFEAYNLFDISTACSEKTIKVTIQGLDTYGNETPARGEFRISVH